jgi:GTP cyclohydrolase I
MIDIQNLKDERNVNIKKVGVKGLKYPITVLDRVRKTQQVHATISMYVSLLHHFKGTHMSRFVEVLNEIREQVNIRTFHDILEKIRVKLHAESAHIEIEFPYFIEKTAPRSGAKGMMEYHCRFIGTCDHKGMDFIVGVDVPVTTVCPCSRAISLVGAHNQRSIVTALVRFHKFFWIEDLIKLIESSASSEVYSLLKRVDEKYVTEQGYNNPMFVEDVVRNVAVHLNKDANYPWYKVEAENFESIHNHSAYACVEKE